MTIVDWEYLNKKIINCKKCKRLVHFREKIAKIKTKRFENWNYWGKPVIGYGRVQISQLNKPLVFSIIALAIIILIFVIMDSFNTSTKPKTAAKLPKSQGVDLRAKVIKAKIIMIPPPKFKGSKNSNTIKVNEDSFLDEFLPKVC